MIPYDRLEPELRDAVINYRRYGREVFDLDRQVFKHNRDEDVARLKEAIEQRNFWQGRIKELIKGREKELNWLLIG